MSAEPLLAETAAEPTTRDGTARRTLRSGFLRSSELHPDRPALEVAGESLTYAERVPALEELIGDVERPLVVLAPDVEDTSALAARLSQHTVLGAADLEA